ncbi:hypothetical protein [Vibrio scophthalmi]|uniref:Uncharacterized protein n=1 Tax=Vibrio scophthalmi TaxID=45658 RepID=A0A1E3WER9_9VIBR|nr:hypothetical protein [Vibrio scophthalmi]ODS04303.1 hypothetical protein VSF3289_03434 [Vibrio scophthalmi]
MKYWIVKHLTREVGTDQCALSKWNIPRNVILVEPLPSKQGFAVVALPDLSGTEYIEDHRGIRIYNKKNCNESKIVSELGTINEGWTSKVPLTMWDEWMTDNWVTNVSDKYIDDYDSVDSTRRALYREISDPLYMESYRKKENGEIDEAVLFKAQADAAVKNIQINNPFPPLLIN